MGLKPDFPLKGWAILLAALLSCKKDPPPLPPMPPPAPLRIVAVGDILMHEDVKRSARVHGMDSLFSEVAPLLEGADLAFANLETPIAPESGGPGAPYVFNAPAELARTLKKSGFTVLATANNHAFDQGSPAVGETIRHLQEEGLLPLGSGRDKASSEAPRLLDLRGVKVALFAFTDLLNSNLNRNPEGPWVNLYDPRRSPEALRAVRAKVDLIVVSLHWGEEYKLKPSPRQIEIAEALIGAGADLILGHHPHVLQPIRRMRSGPREGVVAFSLGNFISNQDRMFDPDRHLPEAGDNRDGVVLVATFRAQEGLTVSAEPLWTENNWRERQAKPEVHPRIRTVPMRPSQAASVPCSPSEAATQPSPGSESISRGQHPRSTRIQQILEWEGTAPAPNPVPPAKVKNRSKTLQFPERGPNVP